MQLQLEVQTYKAELDFIKLLNEAVVSVTASELG